MFSRSSWSHENTDSSTSNNNSLSTCRDDFAQHSQEYTSTTSPQENNLTQYLIATLGDPPQCHYFQANLPFSMHDLPLFPKSVLSFSISHVCCLDGHNLPRSKKPCLCLSCQVISSHSSAILPRQFCWQHFPCFIPLPSMFQLRVSLHTKPNPTAEKDWTCQEDEAGQHWVTAHSILFHSILLQGHGAPLATLTPTHNAQKEKPQTPLFFCFSGRLKSSACFLPWE